MNARGNAAWGGILLGVAICTTVAVKMASVQGSSPTTTTAAAAELPTNEDTSAKIAPAVSPRTLRLPPLKDPRIVVLKGAHRLIVFDGERAVKVYRAAIGEGRADKTREGDKCTPEGHFYVCVKNPKSQYVRSLGLSYPNVEDAERGLRDGLITEGEARRILSAIKRGTRPPWNTRLGGEIMIHGSGAGRDWTLGCVALDDPDILELFLAIPLHTPVEIRP